MYNAYYRHIVKCEKTGDREVKFMFDAPGNRELPSIAGEVPVLPKHWWEGTDAQGRKRDVTATTLEIPLGSAPTVSRNSSPAVRWCWSASQDYWGKDLPVNVGQNNFDQLRFEYFRDDTVAREAFKANQLDWFTERSGKQWSTAYDFPAVTDKRVIKEKFADASSGRMQGYALNLRRPLFSDVRVRRAFNYAYDFEEMNRLLSNGEYHRDGSYFDGIPEFMATGLPEGAGTGNSRTAARQAACRAVHDTVQESGRRQSEKPPATICVKPRASLRKQALKSRPQAGRPGRQAG